MGWLCEHFNSLPEKAKEIVTRIAALVYLRSLVNNGKYDAALKFLVSYGSVIGLSTTDIERYEAYLNLEKAYREAYNIAQDIIGYLEDQMPPPNSVVESAVRAAEKLIEAAENGWIPRDVREKVERLAYFLLDSRVAAEALRIAKPLLDKLREETDFTLRRIVEIYNTIAEALKKQDYNLYRTAIDAFKAVIYNVNRLTREASEAEKRLERLEHEAKTSDVKRYIESLRRLIQEYVRIMRDAVKLLSYFTSVAGEVFLAARSIQDFVERVKRGENPLKLIDEFSRGVGYTLDAIDTALRYLREINRMQMDPVEERYLGKLRGAIAAALEHIIDGMEKFYDDLRHLAAHNDDLWNAFVSISEAYGRHPQRPSVPPGESLLDWINTWLQRFSFEADIYAKRAEEAKSIIDALKWGILAFMSYFAEHFVSALASIPTIVARGLESLGRIALDAITGNIARLAKDVAERAEFLQEVIRSFIPHFRNPIDAAAWIASMAALAALLDSFGVRLPESVAELPVVGRLLRLVIGERITPMSIVDLALPEIGIVLRGAGELLRAGLERLSELLRRAAERGLEPVEVELREKVGEVRLEGEAIDEYIRDLEDKLAEVLRERIGPEAAVRVAREIVEALRREVGGRSEVSLADIMRVLEEASIRDVDALLEVIRGLARFRSAADLLREAASELTSLLERSEEARLEEVVRTLSNVERRVREVQETAAWILEHLEDIRRLFGDKAAERLEEVARSILEKLSPEALQRAREVIQAASGLLGRLEEMKKALASAVERLFGDREVAEMIMRAETPWDAIRAALKALERHPGALKAYEELARLIEEEWKSILPYYSRLAMLLGSSVRFELTRELSEAAARRIALEVDQLPKELQAVIREILGNKRVVTLEDLLRALEEMPAVLKDQPLATLELVEEALRRIEPLVRELERVASEYRNERLAEELRTVYQRVLTWIEERRARILQLYAPLIRTLDELAELFRREGLEDLARLAEEARDALPRTDEFVAKLEELAKALDRVRNPRLIDRIGSLLVRLKKMLGPKEWRLLEPFAEHIAELARELGVAAGGLAGFEIRVGRYVARAMLATSREAAEAMAEIIERGAWKETVRVDGLEVEVERRVELRPNETVIEYRARAPGGYWEVRRIVIRVTCRLGRCYADVFEGRAWDPRLTEEAVALLDYAISKAVEDDPLRLVGDRVIVLLERGSTTLADILERLAEELRKAGEPIARLLESLHVMALNIPLPVLGFALENLGKTVRIGGYVRLVRLLPSGGIEIVYTGPGGEARLVIVDGRVEWSGNPHILINVLKVDDAVRDIILRLVPQEPLSRVVVKVRVDGRIIDVIPPSELLKVIRFVIQSQPIYINIRVGNIAFSLPSFKVSTGRGTETVSVGQPQKIEVTVQTAAQKTSGGGGGTAPPTPPAPQVQVSETPTPRFPLPSWATGGVVSLAAKPMKAGRRVVEALVL